MLKNKAIIEALQMLWAEDKAELEKDQESLKNDWFYMDEQAIRCAYGNIRAKEGAILAYERALWYFGEKPLNK
jgi:hypothetical protein